MPRTIIYKPAPHGGSIVVATFEGLPYGVPSFGIQVYLQGFGAATCSGFATSGSGPNETVDEVSFTLDISD